MTIKRIVVVAGEESGDAHAAVFIRELKKKHQTLIVDGIGGQHMQAAGVHLISDLAKFGVTGLSEVVRHFKVIRRAFNDIKTHLAQNKPDLLILVDYPGFNLRLARFAKKTLNIPILYYISPQIWAWKANRINIIRDCVDQMAVILPFEKQLYQRANVPVSFVGHPLVHTICCNEDTLKTRKQLNLPQNTPLIALLPGSRIHEIERHMPVLRDTIKQLLAHNNCLHFVIPVAKTIEPNLIHAYLTNIDASCYTLINGLANDAVSCSDCAVVASGTASLECALLLKPMCIIYKASWFTYLAASQLIKVKYLGLCNLLQNQMIAPELLQYDCNAIELTQTVLTLLNNQDTRNHMINRLRQLKNTLSAEASDSTLCQLIERMIL